MKTKALSLTLAGLISVQSSGYANSDRTEGVGEQAISNAKENLGAINHELILLDQTLSNTLEAIRTKTGKGRFANGLAVAGAGLGLGLSALAHMSLRKGRDEGSLYNLLFLSVLGVFSVGATVSSTMGGLTSKVLKPSTDTKTIGIQLAEAQKNITAALAQTSNDKNTSAVLTQLGLSIKSTQNSLVQYQTQESEVSRNRLVSQVGQLIGSALVIYSFTQRESKASMMIGTLVMNAGNLAALISGLQGAQTEVIIKEIQMTRASLRAASAALQ